MQRNELPSERERRTIDIQSLLIHVQINLKVVAPAKQNKTWLVLGWSPSDNPKL